MRFGIGSFTYKWAIGVPGYDRPANPLDAFRLLDKAVGFGLSVVQIAENLPLTDLPERELTGLAARAFSAGVRVEVGMRGLAADNLRTHLALAKRFQSPFVRVLIDEDCSKPIIIRDLRPLIEDYAAANVKIALENSGPWQAPMLAEIIETLGANHIGICLDTMKSPGILEPLDDVVDVLASYVINLHINDFTSYVDYFQFKDGTPAGSGQLDIPALLTRLPNCQSAILNLAIPETETVAENIALEEQWAQESIAYLSQFFS